MRWQFFFRPRWVIGHVVVLVMVTVMVLASHWQWSRLQETRAANSGTAAAMKATPVAVTSAEQLSKMEAYRRITLEGTWDYVHTVYVRYPILDGAQGFYALTPLTLADGSKAIVNRGWYPQQAGQDDSLPAADTALVTVTGLAREGEGASQSTAATSGTPPIPTITSIDASTLSQLIGSPVSSVWVQLQSPVTPDGPKLLPVPELSEGSHWSYTLQWAAFAILTLIGYATLLYRAEKDSRLPELAPPSR